MSFRPAGEILPLLSILKISPASRNDTLLIKLSVLSVVEFIENTATQRVVYVLIKQNPDK